MISIIIPAYNSAATIVEALESVVAQSFWTKQAVVPQVAVDVPAAAGRRSACQDDECVRRDVERHLEVSQSSITQQPNNPTTGSSPLYEVIIVDDCSTDDTVAVVEEWLLVNGFSLSVVKNTSNQSQITNNQCAPWRLLRQPQNAGPAAARNAGIAAARGEWIAFLDADDIWLPCHLKDEMHHVEVHPSTGMICGKTILIGGEDSPEMIPSQERETQGSRSDCLSARTLTLEDFLLINPVATSTVLIRKNVLNQVGGFDEQFRGPEDYDLWLRVVAVTPVVRLEIPVTGYRHRPGSLSLDDRKFLPQVLRVLDKAYAPGGACGNRRGHARAVAYQWLCGAWSAAERGDIWRAIRCFSSSLMHWPWSFGRDQNLKWAKSKVGYYIVRSIFRELSKH